MSFYHYDEESDVHIVDCGGMVTLETGIARLRVLESELRARQPRDGVSKLLIDFRNTVWAGENVHMELSRITRTEFGLNPGNSSIRAAIVNIRRSGQISDNERWFLSDAEAMQWLMAQPVVELAEYRPSLLHELVLMWRASFEGGVGVADPHSISEQEEFFLTKVLPDNEVRVAFFGSQLVGFVAATTDAVTQLYVRRGTQRLGVGSALLNWAKARSSGSLWLYTFAQNHVARAFYEKHGFVATAHGFEPSWQLEDVKYCWVDRPTNEP